MSARSDCVLEGPPLGPLPKCSLAEYLVPKLRSLPKKQIIQIDADGGTVQTVEEFLEESIRLSEGLKKIGLKEGDVVGMISRNCFEADAVVLATWLSGAVIAPVADMTVDELKYVLEMIRPKFLFCEEKAVGVVATAAKLLPTPFTIILLDVAESSSHPHMTFRDVLVDADAHSYRPGPVSSPATRPATILFSSGTSGLPKGVEITHANLIFQDFSLEPIFGNGKYKNCLQISKFFWVSGVLTFLVSLTKGITRVLMRETTEQNLLKAIQQYKADFTSIAPMIALSLVNSSEFDSYDVSSMKTLFLGGSPTTVAMTDRIKARWPTTELSIFYGTTEVSGVVTNTSRGDDLASAGRVMTGVQLKVVDKNTGEALKSNCLGEICIKSPGMMKGYVGNEKATRETVDSEGWCHTGDLGYYDDSGKVFIVDRMKEMIKIANMQVAPAEVENIILGVPGVSEAAVAGVTPDGNTYQLMALVVRGEGSKVTEEDIHARIDGTLSDYKKLRGGIRFVDGLPKTGTGKPSRKKIVKLAQALYSGSSG